MTDSTDSMSYRQRQALQTRKRLLEAGREVFLKYGFQKATISQMIKKAQTGYGTAYVYFKNKDELLMILMDEVMDQFYQVAERPFRPETKDNAYEMIAKQVRLFLDLAIKERDMMKVVKEAIGVSTDIERKWEKIRERFIARISQDIKYAQGNGLAKHDLDPALVAKAWFYANEMFMWELVCHENNHSMEDVIQHLTMIYTSGLYK